MTSATSVQVKVNTGRLLKNSRYAFTNSGTLISELLQNARRAGATEVRITRPSPDTLVVEDNGSGIADMQDLLHVAESGWDEQTQIRENSFGMGFLTCLYFADRVIVESGKARMAAETRDILELLPVAVDLNSESVPGSRITLQGDAIRTLLVEVSHDPGDTLPKAIHRAAAAFPLPIRYNGIDVPRPFADDGSFEDFELGRIRIRWDQCNSGGYPSQLCCLQGIVLGGIQYGYLRPETAIVIHLDPLRFKGRMPDRDQLASPQDHRQIVGDATKRHLRRGLEKMKGEMEPVEFLQQWERLIQSVPSFRDLLDDIPIALGRWFRSKDDLLSRRDSESVLSGIVLREELERVGVLDIQTDRDESDDSIAERFAVEHPAYVVDEWALDALSSGHWLRGMVTPVGKGDVTWSVIDREGAFKGDVDCFTVEVIACKGFELQHATLGRVRITTGPGLCTTSDSRAEGITSESQELVVLMHGPTAYAVDQLSHFQDENDDYDEEAEDSAANELSTLYAQAAGGDPALAFRNLLDASGVRRVMVPMLKGNRFTVTYDDNGWLASVEAA